MMKRTEKTWKKVRKGEREGGLEGTEDVEGGREVLSIVSLSRSAHRQWRLAEPVGCSS